MKQINGKTNASRHSGSSRGRRPEGHRSRRTRKAMKNYPAVSPKSDQVTSSPSAQDMLREFLATSLVLQEEWDLLSSEKRETLEHCAGRSELLNMLVENGLLTSYQAGRIDAGTTFGLILGNYRVLDRLGAGGMGIVFRAEHLRMRKIVAVKVLPFGPEQDPRLLRRFLTEIRAIAQLQHPNIVGAIDAGEVRDREALTLHFFVMEYVPGQDLEDHVRQQGPLPAPKACDLMHQLASALAEAHKHNLVHRDIKPSNIQVTPEGQAKLLDFGLARNFRGGVTEPGTVLGTLDYMAPEQTKDAHSVDIRADLYGLGGVLYWCLTGHPPFAPKGNLIQDVAARAHQPPPSVCSQRHDVPIELDAVINRLMAIDPDDRYPTPQAVMDALLPFLKSEGRDPLPSRAFPERDAGPELLESRAKQILVVDDQPSIRTFCQFILQADGLNCDEAGGGVKALEMLRAKPYDLVVLDVDLPDLSGTDVCRQLRENPPCPNLKIIMASGGANADVMAQLLLSGADDFITKPFSVVQLQARVKAALRLKEAQDRSDVLNHHLLSVNLKLERGLGVRDGDGLEIRNTLVLAIAKLVEHRGNESRNHRIRLQKYCRRLAEEASRGAFTTQIDANFIELLQACVPLHDIGKIGLPDHILLKPGKLDAEERMQMESHTLLGAAMLQEVAQESGATLALLRMAIDIVRHHHERYDGTGYPDRLAGNKIPLAARIVAIADVYDALRSRRAYRPAVSHDAALRIMLDPANGQFDPALVQAFENVASQFERVFRELPD